MTDEETIRAACAKWELAHGYYAKDARVGFHAFANLIPGGPLAAAALLRGTAVVVPKEPTEDQVAQAVVDMIRFARNKSTDPYKQMRIGYEAAIAETPYKP